MIILENKDKEFKLIPRTRKVIELTEKNDNKNLNDIIFKGYLDNNIRVLANIILAFAENDDASKTFKDIGQVYDFIDNWIENKKKTTLDLYDEVIEVVNEMGFFKKKMSSEEIEDSKTGLDIDFNMNNIIMNIAEKKINAKVEEEFQGFKG